MLGVGLGVGRGEYACYTYGRYHSSDAELPPSPPHLLAATAVARAVTPVAAARRALHAAPLSVVLLAARDSITITIIPTIACF